MIKKFFIPVFAALFVFTFIFISGCGGGSSSSENSNDTTTLPESVQWTKVVQFARPSIGDARKIATSSFDNGWAIGSNNFWELSNGTWTKKEDFGNAPLDAIALVDQNNGWAVGDTSVWKLENGTWNDVSGSNDFYADQCVLDVIDMNTGWAGGVSGALSILTGGTWSKYVSSPVSGKFTAIDLADGSNGWGTADDHKFYKLETNTWSDSGESFTNSINKIVISDISNGFAYGSHIWELAVPPPGGPAQWSNKSLDPTGTYDSITFLGVKEDTSSYSGWALCDPDTYVYGDEEWRTLTDGAWDTDYNSPPSASNPVKIINESNGDAWAVCDNGAIWDYDSLTGAWTVTQAGGRFYYDIVADLIDINNGRVVGSEGTNLKLVNGQWDIAPLINIYTNFKDISLTDIDTGFAVGSSEASINKKVFAKLASGTWTLLAAPEVGASNGVTAVALVDKDNGWAGGTLGGVDAFWKLETGTWSLYTPAFITDYKPTHIHLTDINNGWATAKNGAKWILQTGTWSLDRAGRSETYDSNYEMFFPIDADNGWEAMYSNGSQFVWKLTNNTWEQYTDNAFNRINCWAFQDMDNGWMSVTTGTTGSIIYKIEDGTWSKYTFSDGTGVLADSIKCISLIDYKNGWAIADNMSIYRLSPNE